MPLIGSALSLPMPAGVGVSTASSFSPLDLSPALWLDASDESTLSGPGGGAVSQWDDKSGNGNNLTQATASLQPTTGTNTVNGLNVVSYDNDSMLSPSLAFTGLTMIAVFRHSSENFILLGTNSLLTYAGVGQSGSSSTTLTAAMGTMSLRFDGTPFAGTTRGDVYDALDSSTKVVTVELSGSFTKALDPFGYTDDANRPIGDIAEVIVVDGTLTAQQIAAAEAYLTEKWIPVPLRVGATAWFDASDTDSITQSGGAVSQWSDLSGNGYDLTQATSANQPLTGSRTLNGRNVIDFDDDVLVNATFTTTSPYTLIAVVDLDAQASTDYLLSSNLIDVVLAFENTGQAVFIYNDSQQVTGANLSAGSHLIVATFDGSSSSVRVDGSSYSTGTVGTLGMSDLYVGRRSDGAGIFYGGFAEAIIVDGTLTADEITLVEDYLTEKWITPVPEALGATLWLDASDTSTIVETSGSVSEWQDKSGNGNDLTQGTGANQPTTGTRTMNGLNVLDFDGTSDYLAQSSAFSASLSSWTVFAVMQADSTASIMYVVDGLSGGSRSAVGHGSSTQYRLYQGTTVLQGGTADASEHILRGVFDTTDTLHVDGVSVISGNSGTGSLTGVVVGAQFNEAGAFWNGTIAEVAVFDGTLTDAEIAQMEAYLNDKWGIQPIPLQVGATAWFDASDPYTIIETSGAVSQWNDKSGNGYDLVQATAANQPTTGTRTLNGLNTIEFVNADWMRTTAGVTLAQPFSVFAVCQWDTSGRLGPYLMSGYNDLNMVISLLNTDDLRYRGGATSITISNNVGLDAPHIVGGLWDGASSVFRLDGATSAQTVGTTSTELVAIGAAGPDLGASLAWLDGFIAELIVVDGTLTADEITLVENYLANKWDITL